MSTLAIRTAYLGIRGLKSDKPEDFLTARLINPNDERAQKFSKLGASLIWPGQFVLGKQRLFFGISTFAARCSGL